jgi:hypothetical protein
MEPDNRRKLYLFFQGCEQKNAVDFTDKTYHEAHEEHEGFLFLT